MTENKCTVPPAGWSCSRDMGHGGPCAASPVAAPTERVETSPDPRHFTLAAELQWAYLKGLAKKDIDLDDDATRVLIELDRLAAVAPSPAPASQAIIHEGFSTQRLRENPLESAYAKAWKEQAPTTLGWLLMNSLDQPVDVFNAKGTDYSARDAKVAATIIQWLGSPVGRSFVAEVLEKAGKQ